MYAANNEVVPDFFIVGAPKAGTTALDVYLRQHPDVFMCRKKVHYFCTDFPGNVNFESFSDCQKIFDDVEEGQTIGEALLWYLYSEATVRETLALNPDARFMPCCVNPSRLPRPPTVNCCWIFGRTSRTSRRHGDS